MTTIQGGGVVVVSFHVIMILSGHGPLKSGLAEVGAGLTGLMWYVGVSNLLLLIFVKRWHKFTLWIDLRHMKNLQERSDIPSGSEGVSLKFYYK
jgi:hypothetical protein